MQGVLKTGGIYERSNLRYRAKKAGKRLLYPLIYNSLYKKAFIFCVHYSCLIGRFCVFYVGHIDKSNLYETLFHCNILSKHHHHTGIHSPRSVCFTYTYKEVDFVIQRRVVILIN
jgi:hypothetical protein